MKRSKTTGL